MAQSMTFTLNDNVEAVRLLEGFCLNQRYDRLHTKDNNPAFDPEQPEDPDTNPQFINIEGKKAFMRRITIQWWRASAIQGETRDDFQSRETEFNGMSIDSAEV